jgi:hypothetical protein
MSPLFESLLLAAHLLCVNLAAGGPLVAAWLDWRGTRGDAAAARGAAYLARASVLGLILGGAVGVWVGWLKWDADYRALWLGPLGYKLHWAGLEAIFSLVLLGGWWLFVPGRSGGSWRAVAGRGIVAALASTNLLYHFPLLFSVAAQLSAGGQTTGALITGAEFRRLMIAGPTPALAVHVVLASTATAGVMLLGLALRWQRAGEAESAERMAVWGGRVALLPTILQLPVGLWTLATLPAGAQSQLMGENALGTLLFLAALFAAFWLVNDLVRIALREVGGPLLIRAMAALVVTVVLMTMTQRQTRVAEKSQSPSATQARNPP